MYIFYKCEITTMTHIYINYLKDNNNTFVD